MPKLLKTTNVTPTVSMPVQGATLQFLQDAHREITQLLAKALVGQNYSAGTPIALYGCNNTGSGSNYVIQPGLIYVNSLLYVCAGATFTLTGGNVAIMTETLTQLAGVDPVTFSDSNNYNIHDDYTMVAGQGASGSGTFNYSSLVFLNVPHYVGTTGEPAYNASYSNYNSGGGEADKLTFIRQGNKITILGTVNKTNASASTTIFTLPTGFRPTVGTVVQNCHNITTNTLATLSVDTSGNVIQSTVALGTAAIFQINMSFYI